MGLERVRGRRDWRLEREIFSVRNLYIYIFGIRDIERD